MTELEDIVKEFYTLMREKLERKQKVYGNTWKRISTEELIELLEEHVVKAKDQDQPQDWIDIGNIAMFLWKRSSELDLEAREMASGNIVKGFD